MASKLTPEVFGASIPVARITPMAQGIVARTSGSETLRWAGFAWHRPRARASGLAEAAARGRQAA
jgi:hypothetical protein